MRIARFTSYLAGLLVLVSAVSALSIIYLGCASPEPANVCEPECQQAGRVCDGAGTVRNCFDPGDGCYQWSEGTVCPEGSFCNSGVCQTGCAHECVTGSIRCHEGGVQSCVDPGNVGCPIWTEPNPCGEGRSCVSGECIEGCRDECTEHNRQCSGSGYQVCGEFDDDDCVDWGPLVDCEPGESCSLGECSIVCSDECEETSRTCVDGGYQACGNFDGDECLEWSETVPCDEGLFCSHGECAESCDDDCTPGVTRCASDGVGYVSCGQFDQDDCLDWGPVVLCPESTTCSLGVCSLICNDECVDSSSRCVSGNLEMCGYYDSDECLEWSQSAPCGEGESCSAGHCVEVCEHECIGDVPQCAEGGFKVCGNYDNDSCNEWGPVTRCREGEVCSFGECTDFCDDECSEDSRRCGSGGYQVCGNFDGDECREWSELTTCSEGETCSLGSCALTCSDECTPQAVQCSDGGVQSCGNFDGDECREWGIMVSCGNGTVCSFGRCVEHCEDECAPDSVRCQGDSILSCDNFDTDSCLEWGSPVTCGELEVCIGGACTATCHSECSDGFTRCNGSGVQECAEVEGCFRWGATIDGNFVVGVSATCQQGLTCSSGECLLDCQDECNENEVRCEVGGVQQCGQYDGDSCRDWSLVILCSDGQTCSNGQCLTVCEDECSVNEKRCVDGVNAFAVCGQFDDDDCRDWGVPDPCADSFECSEGECLECVVSDEVPDGIDNDCDEIIDEAPEGSLPDWCILQHPASLSTTLGVPTVNIYGRVFEPEMTNTENWHPGIIAQLGVGPDGSEPFDEWVWANAIFNDQYNDNDEYQAAITVDEPGEFDYSYRFSIDGGVTWLYCDLNGSTEGGYTLDQAGSLTIGTGVDWGNLQSPHDVEVEAGETAGPFFGQVYLEGVTEAEGPGEGITVQLGYGPDGTHPSDTEELWSWIDAVYNEGFLEINNNDEYIGSLIVLEPGEYDVAFRYSGDGGRSWLYGDIDGSGNDYNPDLSCSLTVTDVLPPVEIVWAGEWGMYFSTEGDCATGKDGITEPITVEARGSCHQIIAEVYVPGITDSDESDHTRVTAQMVRTPIVNDVPGEEQILDLIFYGRINNNHEYRWDVPISDFDNLEVRLFTFIFRFSGDDGNTWFIIGQEDGPEGGEPRTLTYTF